jgi:hypothetical protein
VRDNGKTQPIALFSNDIQPDHDHRHARSERQHDRALDAGAAGSGRIHRAAIAGDRARIGAFGDQIVIRPDAFTSDQEELQAELANLRVRGASPLWMSLDRSITALQPEQGRRALLVFTTVMIGPGPDRFTRRWTTSRGAPPTTK